MKNNFLLLPYNFFVEKVINRFPNQFNLIKNIFAILGIFLTFYFIFFLGVTKPQMIKDSEDKIKILNEEIKTNNKEISKLEKENKKIYSEVSKLNGQLSDLQIKNKKYVKEHEKSISRINSMSNNKLSSTFADAFDE
jgi:peptidoglycan hydrolase CwlO-like protein